MERGRFRKEVTEMVTVQTLEPFQRLPLVLSLVRPWDVAAGTGNAPDDTPFGPLRQRWWTCLRQAFPENWGAQATIIVTQKSDETAEEFMSRVGDEWTDESATNPSQHGLTSLMFKQAVWGAPAALVKDK